MRHGQSTFNAEGRFEGCCNEPVLTPAGIATAMAAAVYLQDANLEAIITSPLRRASRTAVRIFLRLRRRLTEGPSFRIDPHLREIDVPQWEGWPLASLRVEFYEQYRNWRERPHLFHLPEQPPPVPALFERARQLWGDLLGRFAGGNVLLVTHSGTSRALISTALGIAAERFHQMQQSNGGISVLEFPDGSARSPRLHAMNTIDYLGQELPKLKETKVGVRILLVPTGCARECQMQHAASLLRKLPIDAAFADCAANRKVASMLLDGANVDVCESIPQQSIPAESLRTLLWVVHERTLQGRLADLLGMQPANRAWLRVAPFTFTVVHYPVPGRAPVLQAMNLHDRGRLSRAEVDKAPARA
jgi:probable phosphoglycerate mutase